MFVTLNYWDMKNMKFLSFALAIAVIASACKKDDSASTGGKCDYQYAASDIKATVDAKNVGKFSGLIFQYAKTGSTIKDGTKADFELMANGDFIVKIEGMEKVTLVNPTLGAQGGTALYYTDSCSTKLKYEVSFKTDGSLNEVNVGSLSGTFYGQFQ